MEKLSFFIFAFGFCLVNSCDNFRYDNLVFRNSSAESVQADPRRRESTEQIAEAFGAFRFRWFSSLSEDSECKSRLNDVQREAESLNLWALKMLDSSANLPSGILNGNLNQYGDFDECLSSKGSSGGQFIQGKYCLANVGIKINGRGDEKVKKLDAAIHSNWILHNEFRDQGHRIPKFETFNVGICVPSICDRKEIEFAVSEQLNKLSKGFVKFEVSITEEVCYVDEEKPPSSVKSIVWCFFLLIASLTMLGTLFDDRVKANSSKISRMLVCFSLKRNLQLLLKTSSLQDDIKCIHGARFLNAVALLLSHKQIAMLFSPTVNRTQMSEDGVTTQLNCSVLLHRRLRSANDSGEAFCLHKPVNGHATCYRMFQKMFGRFVVIEMYDLPVLHGYSGGSWTMIGRAAILYTDTFILFSGLLISYSIVKDLDLKKKMNFKEKLINRVVRLLPNLVGVILFCTYIMNDMNSGPQWGLLVNKYTNLCKKYMWRNFFFVHNFFGFENMCLTHTHQLGIDMQLFLASPIFIYIIWKAPKIGTSLLAAVSIASTWLRYEKTQRLNLSTLLYYGISVEQLWKTANNSYIMPVHRLTVYLTGVMLGYYLRRGGRNLNLSYTKATIGWILAISAALLAVFGTYQAGFKEYVYNVNDAAKFNAFAPVLWTVFVSWSLLACENGYGGMFNKFLSWKYFTIFTRISYALYLTQFPVFFYNVGSERTAQHFKGFHSLFDIEELSAIFIASIVLTLTFDIPSQELKKILKSVPESVTTERTCIPDEEDETVRSDGVRQRGKRLQSFGT